MNPKSPAEVVQVVYDFREEMADGEYLVAAAASLSVPGTMSITVPAYTTNAVSTILSGGAQGNNSRLTMSGISNLSNEYSHSEFVSIDDSFFKDFSKLASDEFPVAVDFSQRLYSPAGPDGISAATIKATDSTGADVTGSIIAASDVESPNVRLIVTGGTAGKIYRITIQISTVLGYVYETALAMRVTT